MERNPYLTQTHKGIKHSYSYDMQTGKYYLESGENNKQYIHKIGKFPSKFKTNGSGVWNVKKRLEHVQANPQNEVYRHHMPNLTYKKSKAFYTPVGSKFNGYAQRPRVTEQSLPEYLRSQTPVRRNSHIELNKINKKSTIQLGKQSITQPIQQISTSPGSIPFFRSSLISMLNSQPSIKKPKRSCFNHRCRQPNFTEISYQNIISGLNNSFIGPSSATKMTGFTATQSYSQKYSGNF